MIRPPLRIIVWHCRAMPVPLVEPQTRGKLGAGRGCLKRLPPWLFASMMEYSCGTEVGRPQISARLGLQPLRRNRKKSIGNCGFVAEDPECSWNRFQMNKYLLKV